MEVEEYLLFLKRKKEREKKKMLNYEFFETLAEYANENWKCKMSETELYESAMVLFRSFTQAKRRGIIREDSELYSTVKNLIEDFNNGNNEAVPLLNKIMSEFDQNSR